MKDRFKNLIEKILRPLKGFWGWWTGELMTIRRELFVRRAQEEGHILHFRLAGDILYVSARIDQKWQDEVPVSLNDNDHAVGEIKKILANVGHGDKWQTIIQLPREYCLAKSMNLPRMALGDLREILVNQIDRLVPYAADQVYFDYELRPEDYTAEQIKLDLFIVPKVRCDTLFELMGHCGLAADYLEIAGVSARPFDRIKLVSNGAMLNGEAMNAKPLWLMAGAVCLLALLPTAYNHYRISALEANIGDSKFQARSSAQLKRDYENLKRDARFLVDKKMSRPMALHVISEVSTLLGDDTWLEQLTLRKDVIQIFGYSATAAGVLADMEISSIFANAHFISAVVQQKDKNVERFQVAADVRIPPENAPESDSQGGEND